MEKRITFAFLLISVILGAKPITVFAQEQDTLKTNRWAIGLDLLTLVDKHTYPDYSVFARYLLNPDAEKSTFLRFRMGYGYEALLDTASSGISLDHSSGLFRYALALGIQRDLVVNKRSNFYTGSELAFHDSRFKRKWDITHQTGYYNVYQQRLSFYGILGYNYKLNKQLSFSLETSLSVDLKSYVLDEDLFYESGGVRSEHASEIIQLGINPFHHLLIIYNF